MSEPLKIACRVACVECGKQVEGTISLDDRLTVCDSEGFLIAGLARKRCVCDACCEKKGMPMSEPVGDIQEAAKSILRGIED